VTWVWLAAVAAVCYALQGAWTKRLTRMVSRQAATWAIFAFALPILGGYLALRGLPEVQTRFWPVMAVNVALYVVSFRLYVSALEVGELGLTYPLLALTPVLVVPVEWILLGDRVRLAGLAGVVLVAAGVYLLNLRRDQATLLAPIRGIFRDPGCRRMLAVAALWSISGTLDRAAVMHSSPGFYGVAVSLSLGVLLLPGALRGGRGPAAGEGDPGQDEDGEDGSALGGEGGGGAGPASAPLSARIGGLTVQGLLFAVMFVSQMEALRLSLAANVITVKRSGTLLTVLMGGLLFQEEGLLRRLLATAVLLGGVYLVATS